jgi:hypothetical protein
MDGMSISRKSFASQDSDDFPSSATASGRTALAFPRGPEPALPAVSELDAADDRNWFDDYPGRSF